MDNTILYRMSSGIAGAISRPQDLTVEPQTLDSTGICRAGLAGKFSAGKFVPIEAADTAAVVVRVSMFARTRQPRS